MRNREYGLRRIRLPRTRVDESGLNLRSCQRLPVPQHRYMLPVTRGPVEAGGGSHGAVDGDPDLEEITDLGTEPQWREHMIAVCSDIGALVHFHFDAAASDARSPAVCFSRRAILQWVSYSVHTVIPVVCCVELEWVMRT